MAKRLIDADKLHEAVQRAMEEYDGYSPYDRLALSGLITADDLIDDAPTVDAVEVCYCKDCSKWMSEFGGCKEFTTERLPTGGKKVFITKPDDFCSYGERNGGQAPQREDV